MAVLDASATLEVLLKTPKGLQAAAQILSPAASLQAPNLLDIEFVQALRHLTQAGARDARIAAQAPGELLDLHVIRHEHPVFLPRIWELRSSISAYDAADLALAEALDTPHFTCAAELGRSHGHRAKLVLLA
jgi:predicted nucleic acid-binding protein